jgi:uncharacterized membrane protein
MAVAVIVVLAAVLVIVMPLCYVRSSLCPCVLVAVPSIVVHSAMLAVVVGVTSRRSRFPLDARAENRRGSSF